MFAKYLKDTWIDKDGVKWWREKNGGILINFLAEKAYDLMWAIEERLSCYQLMTDADNLFDKELEKVALERLSKYDNLNAKFTESFGDDWGNDDDYFEGAAI